jgi:uncharacterized protein
MAAPEREEGTSGVVRDGEARGIWPWVALFLVVTFACPVGLRSLQGALGVDPAVLSLVQFAPALGVLAVWAVARARRSPAPVIAVGARPTERGVGRLAVLVAMVVFVLAACVVAHAVAGMRLPLVDPMRLGAPLALVLLGRFVGACAEELGWRCFLQPTLQRRMSLVPAGVLVGLLWGGWYLPLLLARSPVFVVAFVVSTVSMSVVLAVVLEGARNGRLLVAGTFHFLVEVGLLLLLDQERGHQASELVFAAAFAVIAVLVVAVRARRWTVIHPKIPKIPKIP